MALLFLVRPRSRPIPVSILIYVAIVVFAFCLRKFTKYGRRLNAIGGNPLAASQNQCQLAYFECMPKRPDSGPHYLVLASRLGMMRADTEAILPYRLWQQQLLEELHLKAAGKHDGVHFGVLLLGILINAMNIISTTFTSRQ